MSPRAPWVWLAGLGLTCGLLCWRVALRPPAQAPLARPGPVDVGRPGSETPSGERVFRITTEEYPPFIGAGLEGGGWTAEVARAALSSQGYRVVIDLLPWARAMKAAKMGHYDGLYLSYPVEQRKRWFAFSAPVGSVRTALFRLKRRGDIHHAGLDGLQRYTIGQTRGAGVSPAFDQAAHLTKEYTANDEQSLRKLLRGRIDLFAGPVDVTWHVLRERIGRSASEQVVMLDPPLAVQTLHLAVSRRAAGFERKLADFDRGLRQIRADGTYQRILDRRKQGRR